MIAAAECRNVAERIPDYIEGQLSASEQTQIKGHLLCCKSCRETVKRFREVRLLLRGALGPEALNPELARETSKKLQAVHPDPLPPLEERLLAELRPESFARKLQRRLGAVPWWMLSGAFHALLLLLLTLIGMAYLGAQKEDVVIMTDLKQKKEPEEIKKPVKRDVFRKPEINATEITDVQTPVVMHEEVDVAETVETPDESDAQAAVGDEGISDVPLGGVGSVAALGLGGGGGGAFGRPSGAGGRLRRALQNGGSQKTESAVNAALEWLARNQEADGHWDHRKHGGDGGAAGVGQTSYNAGNTALALLAFLGAGHSEKVGKYREHVRKGVQWLIKNMDGKGTWPGGRFTYAHGMAALALAEAAAMGRVPETKTAAQRAIDTTDQLQRGKGSDREGWDYGWAKGNRNTENDMSITGWQVMALKSARIAGLHVDPACFDGAMNWVNMAQDLKGLNPGQAAPGSDYEGGRTAYRGNYGGNGILKYNGSSEKALAAAAALSRLFVGGAKPEDPGVLGPCNLMLKSLPDITTRGYFNNHYYWYYGTYVMFQQGGEHWKRWNEALKKVLLNTQIKGGAEDGSWKPFSPIADGKSRVISTALAILSLEVYYRYLPLYR